MYSVAPGVVELWRALLQAIITESRCMPEWGLKIEVIDHAAPAPLEDLWSRPDQGAVFMCGLPFSLAAPQPLPIAAPIPSPAAFGGQPRYWSELVVRDDSGFTRVEDTYGGRLALTVPVSQSGFAAALQFFETRHRTDPAAQSPLFREIIAPTITPLGALNAVVCGEADIAPIDAYAFALLERYRPDLIGQVRSVARTERAPIPLLVASPALVGSTAVPATAFAALTTAFIEASDRPATAVLLEELSLLGFSRPDVGAYRMLRARYATTLAYWQTHRLAEVAHVEFTHLLG